MAFSGTRFVQETVMHCLLHGVFRRDNIARYSSCLASLAFFSAALKLEWMFVIDSDVDE